MMRDEINFSFRHSNAFIHTSSSINFTSFSNNLHNEFVILKKSLMSRIYKITYPKKIWIPFIKNTGGNFSSHLNLHPPLRNSVTKHCSFFNYEITLLLVLHSVTFLTSHLNIGKVCQESSNMSPITKKSSIQTLIVFSTISQKWTPYNIRKWRAHCLDQTTSF